MDDTAYTCAGQEPSEAVLGPTSPARGKMVVQPLPGRSNSAGPIRGRVCAPIIYVSGPRKLCCIKYTVNELFVALFTLKKLVPQLILPSAGIHDGNAKGTRGYSKHQKRILLVLVTTCLSATPVFLDS